MTLWADVDIKAVGSAARDSGGSSDDPVAGDARHGRHKAGRSVTVRCFGQRQRVTLASRESGLCERVCSAGGDQL
jgi:hypothetical protein